MLPDVSEFMKVESAMTDVGAQELLFRSAMHLIV